MEPLHSFFSTTSLLGLMKDRPSLESAMSDAMDSMLSLAQEDFSSIRLQLSGTREVGSWNSLLDMSHMNSLIESSLDRHFMQPEDGRWHDSLWERDFRIFPRSFDSFF